MIKYIFLIGIGFFGGLWIAWPGITDKNNWACARDVVTKSQKDQVDLRAVMSVTPKYVLETGEHTRLTKIRLVGDACFR